MKNLILIAALVLSASQAFASPGAKTVAHLTSVNDKIAGITLDDSGLLTVTLHDDRAPLAEQLSTANTQSLTWLASSLSTAELKTEHHAMVCMMMVNPNFMPALSVATEDGTEKIVLTTSTCAVSNYTHPVADYALQNALALKTSLITLANELEAR